MSPSRTARLLPLLGGAACLASFAFGWAAARATATPAIQREVVTFEPLPQAAPPTAEGALVVPDPRVSLLYFPFSTTGSSERGLEAAKDLLRCLEGDLSGCDQAVAIYKDISRTENFGGEYPSLQWWAEYMLLDDAGREAMRGESKDAARFVRFYEPDNWRKMRQYIEYKYEMRKQRGPGGGGPMMRWQDEFTRFNSPRRAEWEQTDKILDVARLQPGMQVADIGAGSGFFAFRFADAVGPTGKVYAVELDEPHLDYMREVKKDEGYANLEVVEGTPEGTGLAKDSADLVFLCSTYQTIYGSIRAEDREKWVQSLKDALKPGGRVVISENAPDGEVKDAVPYRGISISKHLVVGQLRAMGFRLVSEHQFIPQRYILVFEEA